MKPPTKKGARMRAGTIDPRAITLDRFRGLSFFSVAPAA